MDCKSATWQGLKFATCVDAFRSGFFPGVAVIDDEGFAALGTIDNADLAFTLDKSCGSVTVSPKNKCDCCRCSLDRYYTLRVVDKYDFISSLRPRSGSGIGFLVYRAFWCAAILEAVGLGRPFSTDCIVQGHDSVNFSECVY